MVYNIYRKLKEKTRLMKKFYIEIVYCHNSDNYVMQSKWFDTEEQALKWYSDIEYVHENYNTYLMSSIFDENGYTDIYQERRLDK